MLGVVKKFLPFNTLEIICRVEGQNVSSSEVPSSKRIDWVSLTKKEYWGMLL
jgi:hypothetical protein